MTIIPGTPRRPALALSPLLTVLLIAALLVATVACRRKENPPSTAVTADASPISSLLAGSSSEPKAYTVSARGGTPATGPGSRYNHCERIWCMEHLENFTLDHYLAHHVGWVLHDDSMGDVFVPSGRSGGPSFPKAKHTVLRLCGAHVHPYSLGGRVSSPVRDGMYTVSLGYNRAHFRQFGTRLEPCCTNGIGWDFVHSGGRFFRFHDLEEYRSHPERGWQKPFDPDAPAAK